MSNRVIGVVTSKSHSSSLIFEGIFGDVKSGDRGGHVKRRSSSSMFKGLVLQLLRNMAFLNAFSCTKSDYVTLK